MHNYLYICHLKNVKDTGTRGIHSGQLIVLTCLYGASSQGNVFQQHNSVTIQGICLTSKSHYEMLWHRLSYHLPNLHSTQKLFTLMMSSGWTLWILKGMCDLKATFHQLFCSRMETEAKKILQKGEKNLGFIIAFTEKNTKASCQK